MNVVPATLFLLAACGSAHAQAYALTDLGLPPGCTGGRAKAVNAGSQVTGEVNCGTRYSHVFLYSHGKMTEVSALAGFQDSVGNAINDQGQIAGVATRTNALDAAAGRVQVIHAFSAQSSGPLDLDAPNQAMSLSSGINNAGDIVGEIITPEGRHRAFLYRSGKLTLLDETLPGDPGWALQEANGINDSGDIVGAGLHGSVRHAFLLQRGRVTDLNDGLPRGSGWTLEQAQGVNAGGDSVSIGRNGEATHVFLSRHGVTVDLGTLPGYPDLVEGHLNNAGEVVGRAETASGDQQCAFLYTGGRLIDLNHSLPHASHWNLLEAGGINDSGVIVGAGEHEGKGRAFLLTPREKPGRTGGD